MLRHIRDKMFAAPLIFSLLLCFRYALMMMMRHYYADIIAAACHMPCCYDMLMPYATR